MMDDKKLMINDCFVTTITLQCFGLASQRFIGIIISAPMSEAVLHGSLPNKRRPQKQSTVYCLFSSIKSLTTFQAYHRSPSKTQNLKGTAESSSSAYSEGSIISEIQQLGLTEIPKVRKTYHCRKCFKELEEEQEVEGVCCECQYLAKLTSTVNFEKFVSYLLEFKTGGRQSYRQESKLRRIESIQSIQSFTLDRIHDSQMRPNIPHIPHIRQGAEVFQSLENTLGYSKRSDLAEWTSSGYFCNGCSIEPIVGRRFHCLSCEDYDLCEKCYFYLGHKHDMKSFKDQPQDIANKARLGAIKRSESLQNTLPFLSSSIRDFEQASKLFRTTALRHI